MANGPFYVHRVPRDAISNADPSPAPLPRPSLEQKWDVLFPLACAVAAAVERFDADNTGQGDERALATLLHMARQLRKGVNHVCPDEQGVRYE